MAATVICISINSQYTYFMKYLYAGATTPPVDTQINAMAHTLSSQTVQRFVDINKKHIFNIVDTTLLDERVNLLSHYLDGVNAKLPETQKAHYIEAIRSVPNPQKLLEVMDIYLCQDDEKQFQELFRTYAQTNQYNTETALFVTLPNSAWHQCTMTWADLRKRLHDFYDRDNASRKHVRSSYYHIEQHDNDLDINRIDHRIPDDASEWKLSAYLPHQREPTIQFRAINTSTEQEEHFTCRSTREHYLNTIYAIRILCGTGPLKNFLVEADISS